MRPDLRARLKEGCLLWGQLVVLGLIHGLPLLGVHLPLIEGTGFWDLQQSTEVSALLAGFDALMLLALWLLPAGARGTRLALAAVLLLAGVAGGLLFSSAFVLTYALSARLVAQPFLGPRFQDQRLAPGPHNPRISLGWVLVPLGVAVLLTWVVTRVTLGAKWASSPAALFLLVLVVLLFTSALLAVWRFSRRVSRG